MGRDHQIGERLVVLQVLVVTRLDVLDEPVLRQECIDFTGTIDVIDVRNLMNPRSCSQFGCRCLQEITRCSIAKVFAFPHRSPPLGDFHQVDPGVCGNPFTFSDAGKKSAAHRKHP